MRIIGLDIHRAFAEAVAWEDGKLKRLGRVDMRRDLLNAFAATLMANDVVVVEATGNAAAVAAVMTPHVKKVVIANPKHLLPGSVSRLKDGEGHGAQMDPVFAMAENSFLPSRGRLVRVLTTITPRAQSRGQRHAA
ncbi:hypothetical protein V5F85_23565, partial [Xanthobacter autotrophicus ATCC 700551]